VISGGHSSIKLKHCQINCCRVVIVFGATATFEGCHFNGQLWTTTESLAILAAECSTRVVLRGCKIATWGQAILAHNGAAVDMHDTSISNIMRDGVFACGKGTSLTLADVEFHAVGKMATQERHAHSATVQALHMAKVQLKRCKMELCWRAAVISAQASAQFVDCDVRFSRSVHVRVMSRAVVRLAGCTLANNLDRGGLEVCGSGAFVEAEDSTIQGELSGRCKYLGQGQGGANQVHSGGQQAVECASFKQRRDRTCGLRIR
jgi:hypothetical protein